MVVFTEERRFGERHDPETWQRIAEWTVPAFMEEHPEITAADEMYEYLRDEGFYVPRKWVREAWSREKTGEQYRPLLDRLDEEQLIPREWHEESEFQWEHNFAYVVKVEGQSATEDEIIERWVTVESDDPLTSDIIQTEAVSYASRYGFEVIQGIPSTTVERAAHKAGAPWHSVG